MDRIIFDNIAAGFPADDNFMRLVDGYRETITQLCKSVFGEEPVILSGLEIEKSGSGSEVTTTVSSGWIWLDNNILKSEKKVFLGDINVDNIVISSFQRITEGIYHNGESHPTYIANVSELKILNNYTPYFPGLFYYFNKIRRFGQAKSIDIKTELSLNSIKLLANRQGSTINISGTAPFRLHSNSPKWFYIGNIHELEFISDNKQMLFPCVIVFNDNHWPKTDNIIVSSVLKKSARGELHLLVESSKISIEENEYIDAVAHINITYNI